MFVALVGTGLIGAMAAIQILEDIAVIDPDTYSSHHLVLPCAEIGLPKVEAVKAYRERHLPQFNTASLPYLVQQLGQGFWNALAEAERDFVIIDTTDGDEVSYHLSGIAINYKLNLIQAKVHGESGFVRVFPKASRMGWCCLGLKNHKPRASCFGIPTSPEEPAPTNASLHIAFAVASLAASALKNIAHQKSALEWRLDLERFNLTKSSLRRSSRCQHGQNMAKEPHKRLVFSKTSDKLTCVELLQIAKAHLGDSASWLLEQPLTQRVRCGECRYEARRWWFAGAHPLRCERCGSLKTLIPPDGLIISDGLTELDSNLESQTLIESGLPYWNVYRFFNNDAAILDIEVDDRPLLRLKGDL